MFSDIQMFLGTFTPSLATTGQMALPTKLRSALGSDRAVITTGFDKCVFGFSLVEWQKLGEMELVKPLSTSEGREVRRRMYAEAVEVDLDDQGRFVIPEVLRRYAGIKERIAVIGAGDHFEIWDKDEWTNLSHSGAS
ncbi:MAG: division/cell wall cluster transcriptional repressor MraZ [Patescibacteria group bacterium]|nr:division/cell wall cluster transcriptional repressor MraZ [Patescibacteria group bacterium]MCL5431722.1 division/cell wall cluster transcriptional repressor MraZ [Patescibacteria group bacterium]